MEDIERAKEDKWLEQMEKVHCINLAVKEISDITTSMFEDVRACPLEGNL